MDYNRTFMKRRELILACWLCLSVLCATGGQKTTKRDAMGCESINVGQFVEPLFSKLKLRNYDMGNDLITFSHSYQNLRNDMNQQVGWQVSTLSTILYNDYYRLSLAIDQGDYLDTDDKFWTSDMSYRVKAGIDQAYTNNDSLHFEFMLATGDFPGCWFNGAYYWQTGQTTKACIDVNGMDFGDQNLYFSIAFEFVKTFLTHELAIKPYYSASYSGKVNLVVSDKLSFGKKNNYLMAELVTGYLPHKNMYVDYTHITDMRYLLSCNGQFVVRDGLLIIPDLGIEYTKAKGEISHTNWYIQLGIQLSI